MWNETSRRMGPPYAAFVVIIECGMLLMVPIGGMFFLKGSLAASAFLLFVYVGSMYLTEIRPLQELGTNFANVLNAVTKTKEILDIPIYEGGTDFPQNHDIELRNVRFSYDGKTDVLQGVNLKINDGERVALVGQSGAGKSTVIELISRFYDVQEGEVLIGGKNVKELDYDTILKNVAIVFQKTFLTRDSVLENIRMGSNATLEEVRAAAKEAQIDDFMGEIDLNTYKAEKAACDELLWKTKNAYAAVLAQAKQKQDEQARQDSRKEASKAIFDADALTTELAEMLIDRVLVYPDKRIEIAYKIQDIFA